MAEYPYTTVPGKIAGLFQKIKETGVPPKITEKWLKSVGFSSSNDRSLIPILRLVGFIDKSGIPQKRWHEYRGPNGKQVLAEGIREGYGDLFATYPDAYERRREDLESFFSTHSSAGKQAIGKTVSTFQELCKLAEFSVKTFPKGENPDEGGEVEGEGKEARHMIAKLHKGLVININIQLTLPETRDSDVYDALFLAMKKHLLQGDD